VKDGRPVLEDGTVLEPANVIWCTGFNPGFSWIDLPIFDADGRPRQERGMAIGEPGLYFVGLHFLYAFSSTMIHGVGRDADRVASEIAARQRGVGERAAGQRAAGGLDERVVASEPARAGAPGGTVPVP
jgi:putative flavoprotein involved in K+ transport